MHTRSTSLAPPPTVAQYAPDFEVIVEGQNLDPATKGDIRQLQVTMDLRNMTSFQFSVNNWDDKRFRFKYSDTSTFDVGNTVRVRMGYVGDMCWMVRGQISTLTPQFPDAGPPTIGVSGVDMFQTLRDRKPDKGDQKQFVRMADWEIAQVVAARNDFVPQVTKGGEKHSVVVQKNQDDATFLLERANRIDYDCYVQTDCESGDDVLYFVKPSDARDGTSTRVFTFVREPIGAGQSSQARAPRPKSASLIRFSPVLTASRQVSKITVRGWNDRTKEVIKGIATSKDLPGFNQKGRGISGPEVAEKRLKGKKEVVIDAPVKTKQEARDLAVSLLRERAYEFITGSGQVVGLPKLRPSDNVDLMGLGERFSGRYYVTKVAHALGDSGFVTSFDVRRVFDGGVNK